MTRAAQDLVAALQNSLADITRNQAADYYAALLIDGSMPPELWGLVKKPIMARWSEAGLIYVKRRAWKIIKEIARRKTP